MNGKIISYMITIFDTLRAKNGNEVFLFNYLNCLHKTREKYYIECFNSLNA